MILPNDRGYSPDSCSDPPHASNCFDRYLEPTQSPCSSFDSVGSQSEGSSSVAAPSPTWFTDFVLYDSDDSDSQADSMSVAQTSGSVRVDLSSDMAMIPPFPSSPRSVPVSTNTGVPNDTGFHQRPFPAELDEASYGVAFSSNKPNLPWNLTEPALNLSTSIHPESAPSEDSEQSSPEHSMPVQNGAAGRLSVPRMRSSKCPTCPYAHFSESRLGEHLRKSHAPAQFYCSTCDRGFKLKKDLKRHQSTHEPSKRPFACSCTKTYTRHDGLLRHFTTMAPRPREAGRHKAVKSNP